MQKEYRTVFKEGYSEIIEKRSKFLASVKPVDDEGLVVGFINMVKAKYRDASHNVYAYFISGDYTLQKFSDDGEPAGTAGLPVLEAIRKQGLQNIVVVVTRYFGGTLLGTAGLVRAYGRSAAEGIKAAVIVDKALCRRLEAVVEYSLAGRLQGLVHTKGCFVENIRYGENVSMEVYTRIDCYEPLIDEINEVTGARVSLRDMGTGYITIDQDGKRLF